MNTPKPHLLTNQRTASPVLAPFLQSSELQIVGARYDLDEGKVQPVSALQPAPAVQPAP